MLFKSSEATWRRCWPWWTRSSPSPPSRTLDYPKRYWPHADLPYRESEYEEEFRGILRAAARRGLILEVNTTRGAEHHRGLCPGPVALRWWREEGGGAVAFGSDAHDPGRIAGGFREAAAVVEAAGFRPNPDPTGNWLR